MKKIAEIVTEIVVGDEIALEALRSGTLNLSAYAGRVRPTVEQSLYKEVRKGSIVTALSRLTQKVASVPALRVQVHIKDMNIKSPLGEITYERTSQLTTKISRVVSKYAEKGLFTVTLGVGEVTLILAQEIKSNVMKDIGVKPNGQYNDLVAITVRFAEEKYIEVPNMIYTLMSTLASKRINLIEIVSTFSEISFIVRHKDMKETIDILKNNFI